MKLYLQSIVESMQFENLPSEWQDFDFVRFSEKKNLYEYQQQALKNALKALYKYYKDCREDKRALYRTYRDNGLIEELDLEINGSKKYKIFDEFSKDYKKEDGKIAFYHFINRMSFWMATGSGKTLLIIKLIEMLGNLIKKQELPQGEILFLSYREDLLEQFKNHVNEFNHKNSVTINLFNLKEYESVNRIQRTLYPNEINVYYYRSDLISDGQKDKIIDFRNYDNNGKWYILLDEAHKGDKEDSKRQLNYSIMSRNGFLFNFSATFTDESDFATCVYNFNLEKFIQQGYGKHIFITQSSVEELGKKKESDDKQKQIIILKILLLQTAIRKAKPEKRYHNPLILTLVNSVNTKDSDLYLFFKEIEKIAKGDIDYELLEQAKEELKKDLAGEYEFEQEELGLDYSKIDSITLGEILEKVYHTNEHGSIEVLKIPANKQELVLKLATSDKPFALIKIGDITGWMKDKLSGYQIVEKFDNESVFNNINRDDTDISILMGSRAFYEGWDSNRPNIILYIDIGKGKDARKFVLQSIGRGVRIEPVPNKRKRMQFLINNKELEKNNIQIKEDEIKLIETLFVFGTKSENIKEVVETLREEKQDELIGDLFIINPEVKDKKLYIPIYRESDRLLVETDSIIKYEINEKDYDVLKNYYEYIGDRVLLAKYDCLPKVIKIIRTSFENERNYYKKEETAPEIGNPEYLTKKIINHFLLRDKQISDFKNLEREIIHFQQIRISKEKINGIREKIENVRDYYQKQNLEETLKNMYGKASQAEYDKIREEASRLQSETKHKEIRIKYIQNHYYVPLCLTEDEKVNYITHIIKTRSEVDFINKLDGYLQQENNKFKEYDWWYFSKIDETVDEVYIPYYQPKTNRIERFKPDFIFWLKKGAYCKIIFVDPKGTEHTDALRKIEGYSRIFEVEQNGDRACKEFERFSNERETIIVKLLFWTNEKAKSTEKYRRYWIERIEEILT